MPLMQAEPGSVASGWFDLWSLVGLGGLCFFASSFLVQWIISERRKESVIPGFFWWCRIAGSVIMVVYFVGRQDSMGILGYLPGFWVYYRNLKLSQRRA